MKKVAKIDPEAEFNKAILLVEELENHSLNSEDRKSLKDSIGKVYDVARILIEREIRRRGPKKSTKNTPKDKNPTNKKEIKEREDYSKRKPSDRYPHLESEEHVIGYCSIPKCKVCDTQMRESGLYDTSERLEVQSAKYFIKVTKRVIYNCGNCYQSMLRTPIIPQIIPKSNYGDSLVIDVALSKFCDLIPTERYKQIAFRSSNIDLPANSLIGTSHHAANFFEVCYNKIREEQLKEKVLILDESPLRMLEGDDRKSWYLWGFASKKAIYFEAHNTRSGDVATDFLIKSSVMTILTDGYPGYNKARKDIERRTSRIIAEAKCNSHAIRYFQECNDVYEDEVIEILVFYKKIYDLEDKAKISTRTNDLDCKLEYREQMIPYFEKIKLICEQRKNEAMKSGILQKAIQYFLNHYTALTRCTIDSKVPLDTNLIEREFRAHVIGRKTWFGHHSKRGARTAAVHLTLVHSCKINNINPRIYYAHIAEMIHHRQEILTPYGYSKKYPSG